MTGSPDLGDILGDLGSPEHATSIGAGIVLWCLMQDVQIADARAAMTAFAAEEDVRAERLEARTNKLVQIGSTATFSAGLARVDGLFVPVTVAVTEGDFVLLDALVALEPTTELGRIVRETVVGVEIVDAYGDPVVEDPIDPLSELEEPPAGFTLVLRRADAGGTLPPIGFLFRSGEPAVAARDRFRAHTGGPGSVPGPPASRS